MSNITPFSDCIARPTENERVFYLTEHLEGVRRNARSFFTKNMNSPKRMLLELAAVSHDIGKAHYEWQQYIRQERNRGPNHSGCGAMLFSYLAYNYLTQLNVWDDYKFLWLNLTRDIADHHGRLKGYAKNADIEKGSFDSMDIAGIQAWILNTFKELNEIVITAETLEIWQYDEFEEVFEDTIFDIYDEQREKEITINEMMDLLQQWRLYTSIFISSDRFDVEKVSDKRFDEFDWCNIEENIDRFCEKGKDHPLSAIRSAAQASIIDQWKLETDHNFYVLEMPTGYGKTFTALKLASVMAKESHLSKIVYVAPYLSILEQNAEAIEEAIRHTPLQHHSMSVLNEKVIEESHQSDKTSDLDVQAWANQVVCTSFVQWMKAIFPSRSQETLRRVFLHDSIIIIDEPQIIDVSVWNLFLKGLNSISRQYNCKVIFSSATMPPFTYGLTNEPKKLTVSSNRSVNRYEIKVIEDIDASKCAENLLSIEEPSGAVIVNTIQDAIDVYSELNDAYEINRFLLHGLMVPIHKKLQLIYIQKALQNQRDNKEVKDIRVVSTQIIEAGADLSFHYMYRALPILPSLTQAAGRVNRHGEKRMGLIETGKFLRNNQDSRFIYEKNLCRISDEILFEKDHWLEEEMTDLVKTFYQIMFDENSYESVLQDIKKAFQGSWEQLSQHEVFNNNEYQRLPIFVPFQWDGDFSLLPDNYKLLFKEFGVATPMEVYNMFLDQKKYSKWSYDKLKRFRILFNQFVLNVPVDKAIKLVSKEDFLRYQVPILEDDYSYNREMGLVFNEEEVNFNFV